MAAYRRPAVTVIQQFQASAPALALPNLPGCIIGPGYQIRDAVAAGAYNDVGGTTVVPTDYAYPGLAPGGIVDLADLDPAVLPSVQKPVGVALKDVYLVEVLDVAADAVSTAGSVEFSDAAPVGVFSAINPGAVGAPLFYLQITGGTGIGAGDMALNLVVGKVSDQELTLSREISVTAADITYRVLSFHASLVFDPADFAALGITKSATEVGLPANLKSAINLGKKVAIASVLLSWRALRPDLAGVLNLFTELKDLEAVFGVGQVVPANVLAYGILTAIDNTATEIAGTGLSAELLVDEDSAYIEALDFLSDKDEYALVLLDK